MNEITAILTRLLKRSFLYHDYGEYAGYNENPSLAELYELKGVVEAAITLKLMETDK